MPPRPAPRTELRVKRLLRARSAGRGARRDRSLAAPCFFAGRPQQHPTGNDCGPARWRARSQSLALAPGRAGGDNRLLTLARRVCSPADGDGRRAKRLSRWLTGLSYKGGHDETLGQTALFPSDPEQIDTPPSFLLPYLNARKPPFCLTPSPKHGPLLYLPRLNPPLIENDMSGHVGTRQTLEVRNDYDYDVGV